MRKFAWLSVLVGATLHAQGIPGVVASGVTPQLVQEGFTFTEGPVGARDGDLYFSDIMGANKTMWLQNSGRIVLLRDNTNGTNGLALMSDGSIVGAEGDGKRISVRTATGRVNTLTEGAPGKPLMAPNDLIVDDQGGIFFTDPGPRPVVPGRKAFVYYLPAGKHDAIMLDDTIARPNGLTIVHRSGSAYRRGQMMRFMHRKAPRHDDILIVDDTVGNTVFAFDIERDAHNNVKLVNKRPFAMMHDTPAGGESGADGLCIDRDGRLYVTSATGVQVFSPKGVYLGTIKVPRQPANVAFAGPNKKTLYITARQGLYKMDMLSQGPARTGK